MILSTMRLLNLRLIALDIIFTITEKLVKFCFWCFEKGAFEPVSEAPFDLESFAVKIVMIDIIPHFFR